MNRYLVLIFCLWSSFSAAVKWDEVKGHILKSSVFLKNMELFNLENESAFVSSLLAAFKKEKTSRRTKSKYYSILEKNNKVEIIITKNGAIYLYFNEELFFHCRSKYYEEHAITFYNKGSSSLPKIAYKLQIPFSIDKEQTLGELKFKEVGPKKRPSRDDGNLRAHKRQKVSTNQIISDYLPQNNTCPLLAYNEYLPPFDTFDFNEGKNYLLTPPTAATYQLSLNNDIYFQSDNPYSQSNYIYTQPYNVANFNEAQNNSLPSVANYHPQLNLESLQSMNDTDSSPRNLLATKEPYLANNTSNYMVSSFFQPINNIDPQYWHQYPVDNCDPQLNNSMNFNEKQKDLSNLPLASVNNYPPQINIQSLPSTNVLPQSLQSLDYNYDYEGDYFDCNDFEIFNEEQNDCLNQQSDDNVSPILNSELVKWETIKDIIGKCTRYSEVREKFQYDSIEKFVFEMLTLFKKEKTARYKNKTINEYRGYIPLLENENKVDFVILKSGAMRLFFNEVSFSCIAEKKSKKWSISFPNTQRNVRAASIAYKLTVPFSLKGEVQLPTDLSFKRFNFKYEKIKIYNIKRTRSWASKNKPATITKSQS